MALPSSLGPVGFINSLLNIFNIGGAGLSQRQTNGASVFGTIGAPQLPKFMGTSPPWGSITTSNTNPHDAPASNVVRYYDLTVARCRLAPDGVEKDMICVNGQFPGPLLEANWGDLFHITVHNGLTNPEDGTVLHWHGLLQKGTPWYDGVPGISQCPIAPGASFTYEFRADSYGTSWYHSHYSAQYTDGAYGPIVIHGPSSAPYDIDLGPVLVSDWYHANSRDIVKKSLSLNPLVSQTTFADGSLVQGKMNFDCGNVTAGTRCTQNAGLAKFQFEPGKKHLLRFVNPSTFAVILVSIDNHVMTVVANDFVAVSPYTTTVLTLAAGQRTDVIVTAIPSSPSLNGAYWIRTRQPTLCALAYQPFGLAVIYYKSFLVGTSSTPLTLPQPDFLVPRGLSCGNDDLSKTVPSYPETPPPADVTITIDVHLSVNGSGNLLYYMSGETFYGDYNTPILGSVQSGQENFPSKFNVYDFGTNNSVRLIFNNGVPFSHPMHVHGQNMYVLAQGFGKWDGRTITRPNNPQRRDTQTLPPSGYIVVQLDSDNPGVWPFHCHFSWHLGAGLLINVVQRPDLVEQHTEIPRYIAESCTAWNAYTATHTVDQIDSGLRFLKRIRRWLESWWK